MKSLLLLPVFMAILILEVAAQINESDTARFQLRTTLTGNFQKGNVEVVAIRSKLEFSGAVGKGFIFKSQNQSLYQELFSRKVDNDLFSRNWIHYKPQQTFSPFLLAYISSSFRRKIDLRKFGGIGVTYQAVNTHMHLLRISAGTIYETTRFKGTSYTSDKYNGSNTIKLWRLSTRLAGIHTVANKHVKLHYELYFQPSLSDRKNYRWQSEIGADIAIWQGLAFTIVHVQTFENIVLAGVKKHDRLLSVGLSYMIKVNRDKP